MALVKQLNLAKQFEEHREEYLSVLARVCESASFIGGEELTRFEMAFATWVGVGTVAVGCANGTDAIQIAALALELPKGSEAIVPAMTYMATVEGLEHAGFKVRLVDIDPKTWVMDPKKLEEAITPNTRIIVPVHLYGQMAEMDRIQEIAHRKGCLVLEDASQAHGAKWKNIPAGHWGNIATFSLYPGKNLGAFGDAGIIVSRDSKLVDYCRLLGNHGSQIKYQHKVSGWNSRLDSLQAAVLNVKMNYIDLWNTKRILIADFYNEALDKVEGITLPTLRPEAHGVFHQYVILVPHRERFMNFMKGQGIETAIHYPKALHQLEAFQDWHSLSFPNAERLASHCVSLPMCPTLTSEDIEQVTTAVRNYEST